MCTYMHTLVSEHVRKSYIEQTQVRIFASEIGNGNILNTLELSLQGFEHIACMTWKISLTVRILKHFFSMSFTVWMTLNVL